MDFTDNVYTSIGDFYKNRFGLKPRKIPVSVADDCPNRRGLKKMETCIFCDAWGSAAFPEQRHLDLSKQIEEKMTYFKSKYKSQAFLVYFQAYTSTFLGVKTLRRHFEEALRFPEVRGIVIGTRPDCLSQAVLDLWKEFNERTFVSVELGVQTLDDEQLRFLRRGHSAQVSIDAIKRVKNETQVDLGVHLMFGLPGETDDQLVKTAEVLSDLRVDNVKLHNLHVLINTPLQKLYEEGTFTPIARDEYARRVALFLQHLSPSIAVHRLAALSSRWDELVAPQWTRHKMETFHFIVNFMKEKKVRQGQLYTPTTMVPGLASSKNESEIPLSFSF